MKIVCISMGWVHPSLKPQENLKKLLRAQKKFEIHFFSSLQGLEELEILKPQVLIMYFHLKRISDTQLNALKQYLKSGGGVVGIHSVTASFKKSDEFAGIFGGRFSGHFPVQKYSIYPSLMEPAGFPTMPSFEIVDEIYNHDFFGEVDVHFYTSYRGNNIPLVWSKTCENGRVVYLSPGHKSKSFENSHFQNIILGSIDLASAGPGEGREKNG